MPKLPLIITNNYGMNISVRRILSNFDQQEDRDFLLVLGDPKFIFSQQTVQRVSSLDCKRKILIIFSVFYKVSIDELKLYDNIKSVLNLYNKVLSSESIWVRYLQLLIGTEKVSFYPNPLIKLSYNFFQNECFSTSRNITSNCLSDYVDREFLLNLCNEIFDSQILQNFITDTLENTLKLANEGDCMNASRMISSQVLGVSDTEFNWGIMKKLKNSEDKELVIKDSISYLSNYLSEVTNLEFSKNNDVNFYIDIEEFSCYKNIHRGGWYLACENLTKDSILGNTAKPVGITLDIYTDRTFLWAKNYMKALGKIPYTSDWVGVIHHTPETDYSPNNSDAIFSDKDFITSLSFCRALIVLSNRMKDWVKNKLLTLNSNYDYRHIEVISIDHPIDQEKLMHSSLSKHNEIFQIPIIHVGSWLRKPIEFYKLEVSNPKLMLKCEGMEFQVHPSVLKIEEFTDQDITNKECVPHYPCRGGILYRWMYEFCEYVEQIFKINIRCYDKSTIYLDHVDMNKSSDIFMLFHGLIKNVQIVEKLSNLLYDVVLSNTIVYLHLYDASAVNTIIECIVRHTPILVNRLEATEQMLGTDYNLFTDDSDIEILLTRDNLEKASEHLKKIHQSNKYSMEVFHNKMREISLRLDSL